MAAANIEEVHEDALNESLIATIRQKAESALKRALGKVLGVFHSAARLIYVDRTLLLVKQTFIRLHETGHGSLPWQRDACAVVEECDQSLDPEVAELLIAKLTHFASDVLFQFDSLEEEADQLQFGILAPVRMSRKCGASI